MTKIPNFQDDLMINLDDLPWIPMVDGIDFKLLRTCEVTGTWTVYFRAFAGSSFPLHRHYGAGEYFVTKGKMVYRAGEANAGDYGYEPLGAVHELTSFPEYTELYFTNFGPVVFLDENGSVTSILDNFSLVEMSSFGSK
jgi:anti-sigma factor ChrR (cupin superfamily)